MWYSYVLLNGIAAIAFYNKQDKQLLVGFLFYNIMSHNQQIEGLAQTPKHRS